MKKVKALCLLLAIILLLSACSGGVNEVFSGNAWKSEGNAYKQHGINTPGSCISFITHGKDYYVATVFIDNNSQRYEISKNGTQTIYSPENGFIECAAGNDEGIWLVETEFSDVDTDTSLRLISYTGEIQKTINLSEIAQLDSSVFAMHCNKQSVYLKCADKIVALDNSGNYLAEYKLKNASSNLATGNDGIAYLAYYTDSGIEVNRINEKDLTPIFTLSEEGSSLYGGNEKYCFLMSNKDGLYGLQADGSKETILIYRDCAIAFAQIRGIVPLPNNEFMVLDTVCNSLLSPVDPSEMHPKTNLTIANVGRPSNIMSRIMRYNISNSDYYIELKDYSDGGALDTATAIKKLNTDMISGKCPDLIDFTGMSPFAYINKGYLMDMSKLFDSDPNMKLEDVAIAKQLKLNGGIYFMVGAFNIETRLGLYSDFGDATGWTLEEYLDVEKSAPSGMEIMYNVTKQSFLRQICSRYLQKAIDWEAKTCDFDNEEFISILEVSSRIKENPEPTAPEELNTTPAHIRMTNKTLYTAAMWIGDVRAISAQEKQIGCRLSVIGCPTVDGSCGSDIFLDSPVGICSQTDYVEGCWDFIKFSLTSLNQTRSGKLPVYMPYLKKDIAQAMREESADGVKMTQEDADRFMDLLVSIKYISLYNEDILKIIEDEAYGFFSKQKTAAETAKLIQSRASIYVAEQG